MVNEVQQAARNINAENADGSIGSLEVFTAEANGLLHSVALASNQASSPTKGRVVQLQTFWHANCSVVAEGRFQCCDLPESDYRFESIVNGFRRLNEEKYGSESS